MCFQSYRAEPDLLDVLAHIQNDRYLSSEPAISSQSEVSNVQISEEAGSRMGQFLLVSQLSIIKLAIIALLIQMESLKSFNSPLGWALFVSLMIAFFVMHSLYDKYHSRYSLSRVDGQEHSLQELLT